MNLPFQTRFNTSPVNPKTELSADHFLLSARAKKANIWSLAVIGLLCSCIAYPDLALATVPSTNASAVAPAAGPTPQLQRHADFSGTAASTDAREVADWIVRSGDNKGLSFIVVDKANAKLFLFDASGAIHAATPVLLGFARGDDSPPGIGTQALSTMALAQRITPAGRFVAGRGLNLAGQDILWVDYDDAISLHRATDRKPGLSSKSRSDRLASATTLDNRISHGCINVSTRFYDDFIMPAFEGTMGIVYVLPETRSAHDQFNMTA